METPYSSAFNLHAICYAYHILTALYEPQLQNCH